MKLAIMQPYFFPYIGYFQLMNHVDTYVVYDDVDYIKGGWINRNYILVKNKAHLLTMSLHKAGSNRKINQIEIQSRDRLLKTIRQSYAKAPFFFEAYPVIEDIFRSRQTNLAYFLFESLSRLARYLDMDTRLILSSRMDKDDQLKGQDRVIDICRLLGANNYYNPIGGRGLYSRPEFEKNGIGLGFIKSEPIEYRQFGTGFVPNLSIIDVLMFNPRDRVKEFLHRFEVV